MRMFKEAPVAAARTHPPSSFRSSPQPSAIDTPVAGVAVIAGLIFASFLLPIDVQPRDGLRLPALLFSLSLCSVPVLAALRDPKSFFRAEHLLAMAPVFWLLLEPIQGRTDLDGVSREDVQRSLAAIAIFVTGAWIAFVQRPWRAPEFVRSAARVELPTEAYFGIGVLAFILAFLKYAVPAGFDFAAMASDLAGGRWAGAWNRGDLGGTDAFLDHLSYFGYLLPPLTVIVSRRLGWGNLRTLCLIFCGLILSAFIIQQGGRRLVGMFFGSGFLFWFLGKPQIRLSTILTLILLVAGLWFTNEKILSYRNVGILAMFDPDATPHVSEDAMVRVDDNFLRLAQTSAIFPELHPYTTWRYALWVAVRPVPRLFWPGKPVDPGFSLPQFLRQKGVSLSSSVIGELMMAGGLLAVALGGWFYGRLARSLSHFLSEARTSSALLIYSVGLFALFVGFRSMIELVLTSYIILGWVALVHIYHGFKVKQATLPVNPRPGRSW